MFLKVAREQIKYFEDEVNRLNVKADSILEFCNTRLKFELISCTPYEKQQLKKMIKRVEDILKMLKQLNAFMAEKDSH